MYIHKAKYYETDSMKIVHHSNYIRWMEEAKMDFLERCGCGMIRTEAAGITSPVVSVECDYKHTSSFDDEIAIDVQVEKYTGVKLTLRYIMTNTATNTIVATGRSCNCYVNEAGAPISIQKYFPDFDATLKELVKLSA
ncbi:MAG: acyl-CoA thioesterase [Lachnospiraceae bacterium]|nr:acyl-CoA thioesterase [Lachnospiraceae bacterium]